MFPFLFQIILNKYTKQIQLLYHSAGEITFTLLNSLKYFYFYLFFYRVYPINTGAYIFACIAFLADIIYLYHLILDNKPEKAICG